MLSFLPWLGLLRLGFVLVAVVASRYSLMSLSLHVLLPTSPTLIFYPRLRSGRLLQVLFRLLRSMILPILLLVPTSRLVLVFRRLPSPLVLRSRTWAHLTPAIR